MNLIVKTGGVACISGGLTRTYSFPKVLTALTAATATEKIVVEPVSGSCIGSGEER